MVIPNTPIILAPIEFTLIARNTPIKIAIIAIKNARIFIAASGSNLCGKNVSAKDIGPPNAVNEMIKLAKRASDSKVLLTQNLQYFRPQQQLHH